MATDTEAFNGDIGGGNAKVAAAAAKSLDYGAGERDGEGRRRAVRIAGEGRAGPGLVGRWHLGTLDNGRGRGW